MRLAVRLSATLACTLVLAACAAVGKPQRETILRVDPAVPASPASPLSPRLALSPVTAEGAAAGRRYAYVDPSAPREVRQAASLFWEEPPSAIVERALSRGLAARLGTPVLPKVVAPGAGRRLIVDLARFEEESGSAAAAVVAVDVVALDAGVAEPSLNRRYCGRQLVSGDAGSSRAAAFEAALGQVMDALAADLARPASASAQARSAC